MSPRGTQVMASPSPMPTIQTRVAVIGSPSPRVLLTRCPGRKERNPLVSWLSGVRTPSRPSSSSADPDPSAFIRKIVACMSDQRSREREGVPDREMSLAPRCADGQSLPWLGMMTAPQMEGGL